MHQHLSMTGLAASDLVAYSDEHYNKEHIYNFYCSKQ
jgi:hypothetical protein